MFVFVREIELRKRGMERILSPLVKGDYSKLIRLVGGNFIGSFPQGK